jgi:hypothetical protein
LVISCAQPNQKRSSPLKSPASMPLPGKVGNRRAANVRADEKLTAFFALESQAVKKTER